VLAQALGLAQDWGVVLADVHPEGPAAAAGLKIGDVVLTLDGKVIENGRQLDVNVYRRAVGTPVALEVLRGGERLTRRVPVIERPDDPQRLVDMVRPEENLIPRLGVLALELTPRLAGMLPALRFQAGVVIAATSSGSPYQEEHFAPGDVLYSVNGKRVAGLKDLRAALAELPANQPAVFHLQRQGQLRYVAFPLE
jgi:serine protease Do